MCIYIYTASSYANGLFLATGLASMSWLLSIALLWALGCVCFFIVEFLFFSRYTPRTGTAGSYDSSCSVTQSCPTLCDPMDRSTPGLPVHHQVLESTQTHVHWVGDAIQPSHPSVVPFSCPQSFPASGKDESTFQMSRLFAWGGQSIGVSVSVSVLPMNIQGSSFSFSRTPQCCFSMVTAPVYILLVTSWNRPS